MNWSALTTIFLLGMVKFMFSTIPGPHLGLPFLETFLASFAGGIVSAAFFYFGSDLVLDWDRKRKIRKREMLLRQGLPVPKKRNFTRTNRFIIKIKRRFGRYGICFWAPFFLSVPLGSIVVAKFYGKDKQTFPLITIGMAINAAIITFVSYGIFG